MPRSAVLLLLLSIAPAVVLGAETVYPISGQTNALDNANIYPRPAAMGSAFTGVADDATALLTNPAGLSGLKLGHISASSNFWLSNILQETLLMGFPVKGAGGFGVAVNYVHYGTFEGRDALGNPTTDYGANRLALEAGWGLEVVKGLSLGFDLLGSQTTLDNRVYSSFALSLGLLLEPMEGLRAGLACDNVSLAASPNATAMAINLGVSYDFRLDDSNRLLAAAGASMEPGALNYIQAGLEYGLQSQFFVRAGYQKSMVSDAIQGLSGVSFGVGALLHQFTLDYAFLPYGDLGASHRASVGYRFETGGAKSGPKADPRTAPALPVPAAVTAPSSTVPQAPIGVAPQPVDPSKGREALTLKFDFSTEALAQAQELAQQGRDLEAVRAFQDILQGDPDNAAAWMGMGRIYHKHGRKAETLRCFERALQLDPSNHALDEWLQKYKSLP